MQYRQQLLSQKPQTAPASTPQRKILPDRLRVLFTSNLPPTDHTEHTIKHPTLQYFAMFGASEDRARQLAYRKRRDRIISGSSYRSLSTTSRTSQQSRTPSAEASEPSEVPLVQAAIDTQQILALYDDNSIVDVPDLPTLAAPRDALFEDFRRLDLPPVSRHARNLTAPITFADIQSVFESSVQPSPPVSSFENFLRVQTMVSLRGGGDENREERPGNPQQQPAEARPTGQPLDSRPPNQQSTPAPSPGVVPHHDLSRPYMQRVGMAKHWYNKPEYAVPIWRGQHLDQFRSSLTDLERDNFELLFGPKSPPTPMVSVSSNRRKCFLREINSPKRVLLGLVVRDRFLELQALNNGAADPQLHVPTVVVRPVMLYHIVEIFEPVAQPPYGPEQQDLLADFMEKSTEMPYIRIRDGSPETTANTPPGALDAYLPSLHNCGVQSQTSYSSAHPMHMGMHTIYSPYMGVQLGTPYTAPYSIPTGMPSQTLYTASPFTPTGMQALSAQSFGMHPPGRSVSISNNGRSMPVASGQHLAMMQQQATIEQLLRQQQGSSRRVSSAPNLGQQSSGRSGCLTLPFLSKFIR